MQEQLQQVWAMRRAAVVQRVQAGIRELAALSALARTMIEKRGRLDNEDVDQFVAPGFGKDHALEVISTAPAGCTFRLCHPVAWLGGLHRQYVRMA